MDRKQIVKALETHFEVKAKYLAAPSFAYSVDAGGETYIIDREGSITKGDERLELEEILSPSQSLEEQGAEINEVKIVIPMEDHTGITLRNLVNMIYSKQALIKKSFDLKENIVEEDFIIGINEIQIKSLEDFKIALEDIGEKSCPGIGFDFKDNNLTFQFIKGKWVVEKVKTYSEFAAILNRHAKSLKYASPKPSKTDNEKYTFRTWLLRLGMIGDEYKKARKELLSSLSGNGAFKKPTKAGELDEA